MFPVCIAPPSPKQVATIIGVPVPEKMNAESKIKNIEKALKTEKPKKSMADSPAPTATKNADMLIYSSIVFLNFRPFVNIVLKILMQANINKMPKEICTKIVMI